MSCLELIDLHFGSAPQAIGVYLVDTDDGPALFDCGPASTLETLEAGLAGHGLALDRRQAPAALAHPSRPRGRGRVARPPFTGADGLGEPDRAAAPDRPVAARAVGAPALRRDVRPAVGRARAGARARTCASPTATSSAGTRSPRPGTRRTTSRTSGTGRCSPATRPASACRARPTCCRSARRRTSTSRAGTGRSRRSAAREPERLALIHFGVHEDVGAHLDRLEPELDRWAGRVRDGMGQEDFVAAAPRRPRRATPTCTTVSRRSGSRTSACSGTGRHAAT